MGFNFNSKFSSSKMISMSQKFRYKDSREKYPGPGQYIRFSEFGILVSKNARKGRAPEEIKNSKTEGNASAETAKNEKKQAETE